jgi:hypothetical protein
MDNDDAASSLLIVETSEWFDWLRRELSLGGISLPNEETSVLLIERALHLSDRAQSTYHHLPDALRYKLIKASIVYQCWEKQREITEKAGWNRNAIALPAVNAISYVRLLGASGRHHLIDASDGFQYAITLPSLRWGETLSATGMICNELARLLDLQVPNAAVVSVGWKLLRLADANCKAWPKPNRRGSEFCCGFRYLGPERDAGVPGAVRSRACRKELLGALVFDIWTLNLAPREFLPISKATPGKPKMLLFDHGHCLLGSKWNDFEDSSFQSFPSPQWAAGGIKSLDELWPWVHRALMMDLNPLWEIVSQMPAQWYGNRRAIVAGLLEKLSARRGDLIRAVQFLARNGYFPNASIVSQRASASREDDETVKRLA